MPAKDASQIGPVLQPWAADCPIRSTCIINNVPLSKASGEGLSNAGMPLPGLNGQGLVVGSGGTFVSLR